MWLDKVTVCLLHSPTVNAMCPTVSNVTLQTSAVSAVTALHCSCSITIMCAAKCYALHQATASYAVPNWMLATCASMATCRLHLAVSTARISIPTTRVQCHTATCAATPTLLCVCHANPSTHSMLIVQCVRQCSATSSTVSCAWWTTSVHFVSWATIWTQAYNVSTHQLPTSIFPTVPQSHTAWYVQLLLNPSAWSVHLATNPLLPITTSVLLRVAHCKVASYVCQ